MKLNRILIACIILISIFAISAANASQDICDDSNAGNSETDGLIQIEPDNDMTIHATDEDKLNHEDDMESEITDEPKAANNPDELKFNVETDKYVNANFWDDAEIFFITSNCSRSGDLKFYVDDKDVGISCYLDEGKFDDNKNSISFTTFDLEIEDNATHNIRITFLDKDNEQLAQNEITIYEGTVSLLSIYPKLPEKVSIGEKFIFDIVFPEEITGIVNIYNYTENGNEEIIDRLLASAEIANGTARFQMPGFSESEHDLYIEFETSKGLNHIVDFVIVRRNSDNITVSVNPLEIESGENVTVQFNASDCDDLYVYIDGAENKFKDVYSMTYTISNLTAGNHSIRVLFDATYRISVYNSTTYQYDWITVGPFYSNTFAVLVKEKANPIDNKTNGNGDANQTPTSSNNQNVAAKSNKPKVTLTLKKSVVKRSAKKLVLKATLKINGKAAKGKIIKFKFNGKTYKAKTNKKGVAKVTIKKKVLRKLKIGKKVKIQAAYNKTVKKFTARVKK